MTSDSSQEIEAALELCIELRDHLLEVPQYLDFGNSENPTPYRAVTQLMFAVNRQNYLSLLGSLATDHVIPAATLARGLLEESLRWEWATDDPSDRMQCFYGELAKSVRVISTECLETGADPAPYVNPSPFFQVPHAPAKKDSPNTFPSIPAMIKDLQRGVDQSELAGALIYQRLYAAYRVLCQFTHTSVLGMIATVQPAADDNQISIGMSIPAPVNALIIHMGAASVVNVCSYTASALLVDEWSQSEIRSWDSKLRRLGGAIAERTGTIHGLHVLAHA
jgi:hypothetical protein